MTRDFWFTNLLATDLKFFMSSDGDERPPKELLQPLTHFQPPQSSFTSSSMTTQEASTTKKPYQITFATRDD